MADLKDDIDKYLRGELSPSEMHALEKKALRDPFLQEALEGSAQISTDALNADLNLLESSLHERIQAGKIKSVPLWLWPMRIAAGLLLMVICTFVIIQFKANKPSENLALKVDSIAVPKREVQPPATADTVVQPSDNYLSLAKPEAPKSSQAQRSTAEKSKEGTDQSIPLDKEEDEKSTGPSPAVVPKTDEVDISSEILAEEKIAQAAPEQSQTQGFKEKAARKFSARESEIKENEEPGAAASTAAADDIAVKTKVIHGKVIAEDGSGLPGVNVMIKGSNIGTVTDAMGNYQIPVKEENQNLLFSFIGYLNAEVNATGKDEVDLQMSEDVAQLSEVVVVGYGDQPLGDNLTAPLELAAPEGGRRAFKQYLEQNLHYPEQALANNVEGKVTIMFTVETSGQLSDFRVLRGIGNGCEDEVIRLIKEGPKWAPSKRKEDAVRDKVKVRMRFALPKNKK